MVTLSTLQRIILAYDILPSAKTIQTFEDVKRLMGLKRVVELKPEEMAKIELKALDGRVTWNTQHEVPVNLGEEYASIITLALDAFKAEHERSKDWSITLYAQVEEMEAILSKFAVKKSTLRIGGTRRR